MDELLNPTTLEHLDTLDAWANNVFEFAEDTMGMKPSEPWDSLKGVGIPITDPWGNKQTIILFDRDGRIVYHDLKVYTKAMFKHQDRGAFKKYKGTRYTWQQTLVLEAYNRALNTFDRDSFDVVKRWITVVSGHGIGKTAAESTIALHFLICFPGAQIGATANSENQLKDIFLKELYFWKEKMPDYLKQNIKQNDDMIRIADMKDWFLRARVSKPDKPEALAGLHGKYVLILCDEASGIDDMTFQVMKGALTGQNFIVMYFSNGTRTEGEFFESHKAGATYTQLQFNSEDSPIVEEGYCAKMAEDYPGTGGEMSDEYRIRVLGLFARTGFMDEKGWIPLFANITILFEPERGQVINGAIVAVDPAGSGKDRSIVHVRDNIYLKEVLNEKTSSAPDLARKIETVRDAYNCKSSDIGVEAFGEGSKVVANIRTKGLEDGMPSAILTDKPREETKNLYHTYKSELAWLFRQWVLSGGIIITNHSAAWLKELGAIKYKRDMGGRIMLMPKEMFKKEYKYSPDRFDAAIHSFFRNEPTRAAVVKAADLETSEAAEFMKRAMPSETGDNLTQGFSSM